MTLTHKAFHHTTHSLWNCYGQSIPQVSNNAAGQWTKSQGMGVTPRSNVNIDSGEYVQLNDYLYNEMSMAVP